MKSCYVVTEKFDYIIESEKLYDSEDGILLFEKGKYIVYPHSFFESFYNDDNKNVMSKENGLKFDILEITDHLSYSYLKDNCIFKDKKNE